MNQTLYERRKESIVKHSKGFLPSAWTKDLGVKYHVKPETVWRDWNRRKNWLPLIMNMSDPEVVRDEVLTENDEVKKTAWGFIARIFREAKDNPEVLSRNYTVLASFMKTIVFINDRKLELVGYSSGKVNAEDMREMERLTDQLDFNTLPDEDKKVLLNAEELLHKEPI